MMPPVRIQLLDPSAFTPPYDHALAAALARAGADVELVTSRFLYGPVPQEQGYRVTEHFYRRTTRRGLEGRGRMAVKLAEHVPDMLRYRRLAEGADLVHYQWLTVQPLDAWLLPPKRPRVLTAHDILPREPRPGQRAATRRLVRAMDAVIAHSEQGAARVRDELGVDPDRVRVIPHGAFDYLRRLPEEHPLPPELAAVEKPVVLFFGLLRPYKGLDVLLEAWRSVDADAELWIVGMPRMDIEPLRRAADARVRFVPRFVSDPEIPAYFRRADLVVLPYLEIDQSGVLYTALAFGKPMVLSDVGGFGEVAREHGTGRLVPPADAAALSSALAELLADESERQHLSDAALAAAAGPYSWDRAAEQTLALYRELLAKHDD
jgi:glycosyltransferase involved in cell wall biosynthesis